MHLQTVTRKRAETCEIKLRNLFLRIAKQISRQYLIFFGRFYENYAILSPGYNRVCKYGNIIFSEKKPPFKRFRPENRFRKL